jgi:hypothetical protein
MDPEQRRTSGHYHTIERVFTISQAAVVRLMPGCPLYCFLSAALRTDGII